MTDDGERIARLEERLDNIETTLEETKARLDRREGIQDARHEENRTRLANIDGTMREISGAFKMGQWVMHVLWAIGGAVAAIVAAKWSGVKP